MSAEQIKARQKKEIKKSRKKRKQLKKANSSGLRQKKHVTVKQIPGLHAA